MSGDDHPTRGQDCTASRRIPCDANLSPCLLDFKRSMRLRLAQGPKHISLTAFQRAV